VVQTGKKKLAHVLQGTQQVCQELSEIMRSAITATVAARAVGDVFHPLPTPRQSPNGAVIAVDYLPDTLALSLQTTRSNLLYRCEPPSG
jgi:hypothetical protein